MSTRGRYGLRAMVELAIRHGDAPARLKDIAQCQDIPLAYLRELMTSLSAAGLVRPIRGPRGGYLLTRPPSEISVLDVVEPLEGPPALVDCTDDPALCDRSASCAARGFWSGLASTLRESFETTKLAQLAANELSSRADQGSAPPQP